MVAISRDELYQRYIVNGESANNIARSLGITVGRIHQLRRQWGISDRGGNVKITRDELWRAYYVDNLEPPEIALKWGMARGAVYHRMTTEGFSYKENPLNSVSLTSTQSEMCFGSLLGDSYCGVSCSGNAYLKFAHAENQAEYLQWKHQILEPFSMKLHVYKCHHPHRLPVHEFVTRTGHQFISFRKMFYPNGVKIVPTDLSLLTPLAIAVWYLDDGSVNKRDRRFVFATHCFSDQDVNHLIEKLASYNVVGRLTHRNLGDKHYPILVISAQSYEILRNMMLPYVIPSMAYKISC